MAVYVSDRSSEQCALNHQTRMTLDAISSIAIYRLKRLTSKPRKLEQVNLSVERLLCCVICRRAVMRN